MQKLTEGYHHFLDGADRNRYRDLARGQAPHSLVIGCSDSRIIPEAIFGAGPGELFVLRNVGNLCRVDDPAVTSAVAYAVGHLKVRNAVILAHGDCGAVKARSHLEAIDEEPIRAWLCEEGRCDGCLEEAIKAWGRCQLERLESLPLVEEARSRGDLTTGLFYFDLETLRLDRYNDGLWQEVR